MEPPAKYLLVKTRQQSQTGGGGGRGVWHSCDRVCHWHDEEIQSILCNITHSLKVNLLPTHNYENIHRSK